jgi:hypothetical protein
MKGHADYVDIKGYVRKCTSCLKTMCDMGKDFHVPRKRNLRQWEKLRILTENGTKHHLFGSGCGCNGPGYAPQTLREAKADVRRSQERALEDEKKVPKFYSKGRNVEWNT